MYQSEVKERIKQISAERREWDDLFSQLQGLLKGKMGILPVARQRQEFAIRVQKLKDAVRTNSQELQRLKYRVQKLKQEGQQVSANMRSVESLIQYFQELGRKVKDRQKKGEQEISEKERWEVAQENHEGFEEESQLIMSANGARDVREQAEMVLGSLHNQGGRLQSAREKMGSVLKNINLSGNIANLIKRRSRQDNKLIMWLSLGLILEIYLCVFYVRPYFKGY